MTCRIVVAISEITGVLSIAAYLTSRIHVQIKYPWYNLFCTRDYTPEAVGSPGQVSLVAVSACFS